MHAYKAIFWICLLFAPLVQANLTTTIQQVKPSVVAIAIEDPIHNAVVALIGTGFAVGDGTTIVTNAHVANNPSAGDKRLVVLSGSANHVKKHTILQSKLFPIYDLAILKIASPLPSLKLSRNESPQEGADLAFTGYPITDVLGLYPATHRATLSAITPIVIPQSNSQTLSAEMIRLLRDPITIYQLDATAYPGNSGSPLFDVETGVVIGIINMVYIKRNKESALTDPSGISYAIPAQYLNTIVEQLTKHE